MYRIEQYPQTSNQMTSSKRIQKSPVDNAESCLVCGSLTLGMHFEVASCRACAAFFRRSVKDKKVYKCRRGFRNCTFSDPAAGKPLCKFCRLKKCYDVGMRLEHNVDDFAELQALPASVDSGTADLSVELSGLTITDGNRLDWDASQLIEEVKDIFNSKVRYTSSAFTSGAHSTPFQQLQDGLAEFLRETCPPKQLKVAAVYDKLVMYPFFEKYGKKIAQMFMSCTPFARICNEDKFKLFKHAWMVIWLLERQFSTCELYGYDINDSRLIFTENVVIDALKTTPFMSGMDPKKFAEFVMFCRPLHELMFEGIVSPMKQLQVSRHEFCYVIGLVMFTVTEVRGLSKETRLIGEDAVDQFSTELHNYYTYDMKITNYAPRHSRLIRLISGAQKVAANYRDYMTMVKVFDIFVADFYDSELVV